MPENQRHSARRTSDICWPDLLLFMAIAGCILSASGVIPEVLSSVAVEFLLVCSLILTGVVLFWLLCPVRITGVLAVLRFRDSARPYEYREYSSLSREDAVALAEGTEV